MYYCWFLYLLFHYLMVVLGLSNRFLYWCSQQAETDPYPRTLNPNCQPHNPKP